MDATHAYETLHELLRAREAARAGAVVGGPDGPSAQELDVLVEHARDAWVGAAVTEIASLRAQLGARQSG